MAASATHAAKPFIIVDNPEKTHLSIPYANIIAARDYVNDPSFAALKKATIYNLCSTYKYQSWGYYVSLLASARGHKIFPHVATIQDFKSQTIVKSISDELDELIQQTLKRLKSSKFELSIYFSKNISSHYNQLAKQLYNLFQAPLLRATFTKAGDSWELQNISPISIANVPTDHMPYLEEFAQEYLERKVVSSKRYIARPHFDLAILIDPEEHEPPSNKKALEFFERAANQRNIKTEFITKEDYNHIPEFDALFIRATTAVNHYTYRFARFAQTEGLAVIDDPQSILKCTNKVFLAETLKQASIPAPKSVAIYNKNLHTIADTVSYPLVLKQPDGAFSLGVKKVEDKKSFIKEARSMLKHSELILGQEFTPSTYDWRIGVLDNQPIFACKYYMADNHWQIYNWGKESGQNWGKTETMPVYQAPDNVVQTALRATKLIGDGLYGVDLKEVEDEVMVIEVNDNPNIDHRSEDRYLKFQLYEIIINSFINRVNKLNSAKKVEI